MSKDTIYRQDAIDAFDCTDELIVSGSANAQNVVNYINKVVGKIKALPSAQPQPEEDCDTCKHGYFGSRQCDNCRVRYPSHYEREEDE